MHTGKRPCSDSRVERGSQREGRLAYHLLGSTSPTPLDGGVNTFVPDSSALCLCIRYAAVVHYSLFVFVCVYMCVWEREWERLRVTDREIVCFWCKLLFWGILGRFMQIKAVRIMVRMNFWGFSKDPALMHVSLAKQSGCNSCCSRVPVYETQYLGNFLFTKAKLHSFTVCWRRRGRRRRCFILIFPLSNKWFHVTCIPWEIQVFLDHGPMTGSPIKKGFL